MVSPYQDYLRQVESKLRCPKLERIRLLRTLKYEMTLEITDCDSLSEDQLVRRFGTPEDAAAQLSEMLPHGTEEQYYAKRKRRWIIAFAVCFCAVAILVGRLIWISSVDVDVTNTDESVTISDRHEVED